MIDELANLRLIDGGAIVGLYVNNRGERTGNGRIAQLVETRPSYRHYIVSHKTSSALESSLTGGKKHVPDRNIKWSIDAGQLTSAFY